MLKIIISRIDGTPEDYREAEAALKYALSLLAEEMNVDGMENILEEMLQTGSVKNCSIKNWSVKWNNLQEWDKKALTAYSLISSIRDAID